MLIFRDLNLGEVCTEICIDVMIDCINKCNDDDCKRQCARDEAICVDGKLISLDLCGTENLSLRSNTIFCRMSLSC